MKKNADVLVDLQFGSTGKGALAGFLSVQNGYDTVVSVNMPNAGHTAYCPDTGRKFIHKVLPSGIFSKNLRTIALGAGSVFSIDRLEKEWRDVCEHLQVSADPMMDDVQLVIHEAAGILLEKHAEAERLTLSRISSTMQGSGEASISKIRREEGATALYHQHEILSRLRKFGNVTMVTERVWNLLMRESRRVLLEGSQGFSLGISAGFYPYCTSRDCTVARVMADAGVNPKALGMVFGSARVHPIRVGNTENGYSGTWYADQTEISFEELGVEPETTTVTGRVRRIATFSEQQMFEAMSANMPDEIFLNFVQYKPADSTAAEAHINRIASMVGCGRVRYLGFGPYPENIKSV